MKNNFNLEVGDSFEIQNENGKHLHFIVAEASREPHSPIILVYVSSAQTKFKDTATIIHFGEHPYITNQNDESWVRYQNTLVCSKADIAKLITRHYGKISSELLERVQTGLEKSPNVKREIKKLYFEWKMNKLYDSL